MTMPQMALQPQPMTLDEQFAYYMAMLFARDRSEAIDALNQLADKLDEEFGWVMDALEDSAGLPDWPPRDRLVFYYGKPDHDLEAQLMYMDGLIPAPYSWDQQKATYPQDYERDWADFMELRERAANGDFGLEMRLHEMGMLPAGIPI